MSRKIFSKQSIHYSPVITWINHNKTATHAFLHFLYVLCVLRLALKICFHLTCRSWFFQLNVKPILFWLSGVAYFIWRRSVKNAIPVTSELHPEWQWKLVYFEINLWWENTNNSSWKWLINFADSSKNYIYCTALMFHIVISF